jgi:hypothetical protein
LIEKSVKGRNFVVQLYARTTMQGRNLDVLGFYMYRVNDGESGTHREHARNTPGTRQEHATVASRIFY